MKAQVSRQVHYNIADGLDLKSPVSNYAGYNVLDISKKPIAKENAITQTCRMESHLNAQKTSAKSKISSNRLSSHLERSVLGSAVKNLHQQYYGVRDSSERYKNKSTQTDYRENDCQTVPWEPPYTIKPGHVPEELTLRHLTWDKGLPAGAYEIGLIHRMRIKRAWERILPPMDTPANIKTRIELTSALEADEWAFRESEIQFIMNLRIELAEEAMHARENKKEEIMMERLKKLDERLNERKQKEMKNIKIKFSRQLRKLSLKHRSAKVLRHNKRDIVKLHTDRQLTFSLPRARYECPRKVMPKAEALYDFEIDKQCHEWLMTSKRKPNIVSKTAMKICPRMNEKNEKKFRKICQRLESLEAEAQEFAPGTCSLLKRKPKIPSLPSTPTRQLSPSPSSSDLAANVDESNDEEIHQAANLLQRLVKGRAIQSELQEGRNCYKELIEELQAANILDRHPEDTRRQNLAEDLESLNENRAREILQAIEGKTISKMLTFLTDELTRLEGEKRAHALALLAERERIKKQIEQASKEQLEMNRREEIDEMYRQMLKINQESVETYLYDIVKEGIEWSSAKEAEDYVVELAKKTDELAETWDYNNDSFDEEGLVSDMLYNLVLPEVEKESARQRLQERQRSYLCAAHASIYEATLNLADDTSKGFIDHDRDVDAIDHVIDIILNYAEISDEDIKLEVRGILKDIFAKAKKKTRQI